MVPKKQFYKDIDGIKYNSTLSRYFQVGTPSTNSNQHWSQSAHCIERGQYQSHCVLFFPPPASPLQSISVRCHFFLAVSSQQRILRCQYANYLLLTPSELLPIFEGKWESSPTYHHQKSLYCKLQKALLPMILLWLFLLSSTVLVAIFTIEEMPPPLWFLPHHPNPPISNKPERKITVRGRREERQSCWQSHWE